MKELIACQSTIFTVDLMGEEDPEKEEEEREKKKREREVNCRNSYVTVTLCP